MKELVASGLATRFTGKEEGSSIRADEIVLAVGTDVIELFVIGLARHVHESVC